MRFETAPTPAALLAAREIGKGKIDYNDGSATATKQSPWPMSSNAGDGLELANKKTRLQSEPGLFVCKIKGIV